MQVWLVFAALAAAMFGAVVWMGAAGARRPATADTVPTESAAWWRLMGPIFAGTLGIAFLAGWALREPNPADEWVGAGLSAFAILIATVVVRALFRAVRSLRSVRSCRAPIATVGLLRCRVVMSAEFERAAAPHIRAAALAHEAAHARARDPLRIWLAQLAADLQWPIPGTHRRLSRWLLALEIRRDDEARAAGASPVTLAESILLAARLSSDTTPANAVARATGDGAVALRVRRLIADRDAAGTQPVKRARPAYMVWCAALVAAGCVGALYGDALIGLLPGVGR